MYLPIISLYLPYFAGLEKVVAKKPSGGVAFEL